ncbi:hypothetical protein D8L93_04955 [Sodalis-like symbiont of Bactericera trigonica]|nr:hypothetical protein D8L93_04955 [Sodalis-like symbiont of Bactericera trigonica]
MDGLGRPFLWLQYLGGGCRSRVRGTRRAVHRIAALSRPYGYGDPERFSLLYITISVSDSLAI